MIAASAVPAADTSHHLTRKLPVLRERLGARSEALISDDRLLTMLRVTKGDLSETALMAVRYILKTLRLRADQPRDETDNILTTHDADVSQHYTAMLNTLQTQRTAQAPALPAKLRGWFPFAFQFSFPFVYKTG